MPHMASRQAKPPLGSPRVTLGLGNYLRGGFVAVLVRCLTSTTASGERRYRIVCNNNNNKASLTTSPRVWPTSPINDWGASLRRFQELVSSWT